MREPNTVKHDSEKGKDLERVGSAASQAGTIGALSGAAASPSIRGIGVGGVAGIAAGTLIGYRVTIGRGSYVGPGASVTHALVGDRVILHAGVRIALSAIRVKTHVDSAAISDLCSGPLTFVFNCYLDSLLGQRQGTL